MPFAKVRDLDITPLNNQTLSKTNGLRYNIYNFKTVSKFAKMPCAIKCQRSPYDLKSHQILSKAKYLKY